jgi:predicted metal-dependent phosphoesterase TrpH
MKIDLHTHMNGNGSENRWANIARLAELLAEVGADGLMLGCHDWVCPPELIKRCEEEFGLTVIRGAEISTDAGHVLALGINEITGPIHGNQHNRVEVHAALREIHDLGGKAILAHPHQDWKSQRLEEVRSEIDGVEIKNLKSLVRDGISEFTWFERDPDWLLTAGSDCHPWEGDGVSADFLTEDPAL